MKFTGKISKSSLHRFIHSKFGKTYKIRKKPLLKDDHKRSRKQLEINKEYKNRAIYLKSFTLEIEEEEENDLDDFEKIKNSNILTKQKIDELQGNNYIEIKNFIYSLPVYGKDVSLERFRPNRDKYSASKITESLLKINIINFCKKIEKNNYFDRNRKSKKIITINDNNSIESPKS